MNNTYNILHFMGYCHRIWLIIWGNIGIKSVTSSVIIYNNTSRSNFNISRKLILGVIGCIHRMYRRIHPKSTTRLVSFDFQFPSLDSKWKLRQHGKAVIINFKSSSVLPPGYYLLFPFSLSNVKSKKMSEVYYSVVRLV